MGGVVVGLRRCSPLKRKRQWGKKGESGPFDTCITSRPLRLTLHDDSFRAADDRESAALKLLLELADPDNIDVLSTSKTSAYPTFTVSPHPNSPDDLLVKVQSSDETRYSSIPRWSQWPRSIRQAYPQAGPHTWSKAESDLKLMLAHQALRWDAFVTTSPYLSDFYQESPRWNHLLPSYC